MGSEKVHVPITLTLAILIAYVLGGGILFSQWEDWPYLDGAYFCFISLSTIGFGDLVPGDSISGADSKSQEKLVICSLYILFGLALIAMCFNLMQEEVIHKVTMCCFRLGILSSNAEQSESEASSSTSSRQQFEDMEMSLMARDLPVDHTLSMPATRQYLAHSTLPASAT